VQANLLKTVGYIISTMSVAMLGLVAWASTDHDPTMRTFLLIGMGASVAGMFLRWLSYQVDAKEGTASASAPRREAHSR
jgi:hypothetical protein